ncbi:MAG: hypothetical protein C0483_22360 [Pirellula sp.]|nr:hypothetical protein [Pirellula sp.]
MTPLTFNTVIHARPAEAIATVEASLRGITLRRLAVRGDEVGPGFNVTFEAVGERLAAKERLYFEPDGSFVWVASAGEQPWQLDGLLADRADRLLYVELKGTCPRSAFEELLSVIGRPAAGFMFQLVREAIFLDEAEFLRYAASPGE